MTKRRTTAQDLIPFVKRFEARIPEVAKDITSQIWSEIPGYASLTDDADRAEVEEAAQRNVAAFMRALAEGRDLSTRDIDALGAVGEQRAHQQIPIEDVLRAFRMVGRVLWDHMTSEMEDGSGPPMDVVAELGRTLMRFTDQISSAVAHHYFVAQRSIVRRQEAARSQFLHDLLTGTQLSADEMLQRARSYGYDLARPQVAVIATSPGSSHESELSRALADVAEELQIAGQPIVDRRGEHVIGLFAVTARASSELAVIGERIASQLPEGWSLGIGGFYPGPEGSRRSYLEAREALEIGTALDPSKSVHPFESYLLYRSLRSDPQLIARFIDSVIGPVIEHDERRKSELVKTLEAYFATDGSAKDSGRVLFAHPHTVTYRLKQIEKLTGRSLRDPEDKLHLHLAVKALRLTSSRDDPQASPHESAS